ncbi:MAG: hypothetical protein HKN49_05155 [Gammaproteobacteria bacterium]|nr:hypothetical protein [Gammaproteobacteria bacterium]
MKYAIVNGERSEARRGLVGECPACTSETIAKCGDIYAHHWAHKGRRICDPWWENETEWHRVWKNLFPAEWQEVVHLADDGEKHIADVQTEDGWTIEFQHSLIKPEERISREEFYENLVWVVDGKLRPTYEERFLKSLEYAPLPIPNFPVARFRDVKGRLLDQWAGRPVHVLIDFGEQKPLWWLIPKQGIRGQWITRVSREQFVQALGPKNERGESDFARTAKNYIEVIRNFEAMEQRARTIRTTTVDPLAFRRRGGVRRRGPGWRL